jgi:amidase
MRAAPLLIALILMTLAAPAKAQTPGPFASATEQQQAMTEGRTSAQALTRAYLARIAQLNHRGPRLNAVIAVNPRALAEARALDAERKAGRVRGPLHGLTVLIKDNIEIDDGLPTTAGSLALIDNVTGRDAPVAARLRAAGVVILGRANLSEWANFRSTRSLSGWSAVGGMTRNPHSLDRTACGSSSGSGASVAAGLAALAVGTETDGSITCPAAMTGIVGLKPTVGLVSRDRIVPISPAQDTAGPMTRTVADAALLLGAMAGSDPRDPATTEADARRADYAAGLRTASLKGVRLGVWRGLQGRSPQADAVFDAALKSLAASGAVLVELKGPEAATLARVGSLEGDLLHADFKTAVAAYLADAAPAVKAKTLADLIAFNTAEPRETALFGQEIFERAQRGPGADDPKVIADRAEATRLSRSALDAMFAEAGGVEAVVALANGPAAILDPVNGARFFGSPSTLPAVSGYPHLVVPAGDVNGLPIGLSFLGPAWSEARLLALGHAYEQAAPARRDPAFLPSVAGRPEFAPAYDPS